MSWLYSRMGGVELQLLHFGAGWHRLFSGAGVEGTASHFEASHWGKIRSSVRDSQEGCGQRRGDANEWKKITPGFPKIDRRTDLLPECLGNTSRCLWFLVGNMNPGVWDAIILGSWFEICFYIQNHTDSPGNWCFWGLLAGISHALQVMSSLMFEAWTARSI